MTGEGIHKVGMAFMDKILKSFDDNSEVHTKHEFDVVKVKKTLWIELQCAQCGETFAVKLPKFCTTTCYGRSLEREPKLFPKIKGKQNDR